MSYQNCWNVTRFDVNSERAESEYALWAARREAEKRAEEEANRPVETPAERDARIDRLRQDIATAKAAETCAKDPRRCAADGVAANLPLVEMGRDEWGHTKTRALDRRTGRPMEGPEGDWKVDYGSQNYGWR